MFRLGDGPFLAAPIAPGLRLCPDKQPGSAPGIVCHGVVEPDALMPLADYERRLYQTQDQWLVEEA